MKIVHLKDNGTPDKSGKKIPMYKDPVFMANLRREIIADHNKKIRAKQNKQ